MQKTLTSVAVSCCLLSLFHSAQAGVSITGTAVSDYTLNGISQTQGDPALQASLDWAGEKGLYAGTWASNVDFGPADNIEIEVDYYIGKYWQLNKEIGLDTGIAYYTYHGDSLSDESSYPEVYAKFGYNSSLGDSELNFFYTNDYLGLDSRGYNVAVAHKFQIAEGHNIRLSYDRSISPDVDKFAWGGSDEKYYDHFRAEYLTSWKELDFNLAVEDTNNIDDSYDADSRIVLSVGKTFNF